MAQVLPAFEEALVAFILDDSEVQSYVRGRIGPLPLEQKSRMPAVTYFEVGRGDGQTQTGVDCLAEHRFQVDAWAKTYGTMRNLADALRRRLNGYDGPMGRFTRVSLFMENKRDVFEDESRLHRGILDFTVWFKEDL